MPQIIRDNQQYHESPDWGLLGTLASCATAVGPGAALALASPDGSVSSYLPSLGGPVRAGAGPLPADRHRPGPDRESSERSRVAAHRPPARSASGRTRRRAPCCSSPPPARPRHGPGMAPAGPPHLMSVVVSGPGFARGLLDSASTRRQGIVTLTDLTPTVAGWLGRQVPAGTVGARISRADRGDLAATVTAPARPGHRRAGVDLHARLVLHRLRGRRRAGLRRPGRALPGRRAGAPPSPRPVLACSPGWLAAAVPLGSYLANLAPWWRLRAPGVVAVRDDGGLGARRGGGRARRAVAEGADRPVRRALRGHAAAARGGRDGRLAAATRRAVRPFAAGQRPLLRHRQRRARRLLRQRPGRAPAGSRSGALRLTGPVSGPPLPVPCAAGAVGLLAVVASGLARVRRQGGRDDRARPVPAAAARLAGRGRGWAGGGRCPSRSAASSCSSCSP